MVVFLERLVQFLPALKVQPRPVVGLVIVFHKAVKDFLACSPLASLIAVNELIFAELESLTRYMHLLGVGSNRRPVEKDG